MGTRADFYVGRGPQAEWLGSIAWDGYPRGKPSEVLNCVCEEEFRFAVGVLLTSDSATTPEMGWPWPWPNSNTTDYSYAWDNGGVWFTCFGQGWRKSSEFSEDKLGDDYMDDEQIPNEDWPDMSDRKNVAPPGDKRSGLMVLIFRT